MKFVTSFLCRFLIFALVTFAALAPRSAFACSTPSGIAGDIIYNGTYNVLQFCNGTTWINAGSFGSREYTALQTWFDATGSEAAGLPGATLGRTLRAV